MSEQPCATRFPTTRWGCVLEVSPSTWAATSRLIPARPPVESLQPRPVVACDRDPGQNNG
jgi:hypothetical protein